MSVPGNQFDKILSSSFYFMFVEPVPVLSFFHTHHHTCYILVINMIFCHACQLNLTPVKLCTCSAGVVIGAPQPAVATPVALTVAQTPQQYQQQQHAHQQAAQENEQFALAWLRATFEPATGCHIEQAELYKQYLTACAKIGRRGVIAPLHFPRCVRYILCSSLFCTCIRS